MSEWGHPFSMTFPEKAGDLAAIDRNVDELTLDFTVPNLHLIPEFTKLRRL